MVSESWETLRSLMHAPSDWDITVAVLARIVTFITPYQLSAFLHELTQASRLAQSSRVPLHLGVLANSNCRAQR